MIRRSGPWRAIKQASVALAAVVVAACATAGGESVTTGPAAWAHARLTQARVVHSTIAAHGDVVHAAHGDGVLYYRRSLDQGATWLAWSSLGQGTLYLEDPVAVDGPLVAIVTVDAAHAVFDFAGRRQVGELHVRVSDDAGSTWSAPHRLTDGARALRVSAAISGSAIHIAWMDYRTGRWDIRYLRSDDAGATWSPELVIAEGLNAVGAERPSLEAVGEVVHLAWMDARDSVQPCEIERGGRLPECTAIYYVRSADGGAEWAQPRRLSYGADYAGRPDLLAIGERILIAYDRRGRDAVSRIGLLQSADGGVTWADRSLAGGAHDLTHARLIGHAGDIHAVWMELAPGGARLGHSVSRDGEQWAPPAPIPETGGAGAPSLAATREQLHLSWAAETLSYARTPGNQADSR